MSARRDTGGGGQAGRLLFLSPASRPGAGRSLPSVGTVGGSGVRGLRERQMLTTRRVPSLRPRGAVALGWGVPGRTTGHDPQREQALFAVESRLVVASPGHTHIPRHTQNDSLHTHTHTHTQTHSEPESLTASTRVFMQSHTQRPTSRGIITQPHKIT